MALYFSDITDGFVQRDDVGTECVTLDDVRVAALNTLPEVAREDIPRDGNRRVFSVTVRDEGGQAVFVATLAFVGMWLVDRPGNQV